MDSLKADRIQSALLLAGVHYHLHTNDKAEAFYSSEMDLDMANKLIEITSEAFGYDILEDEKWEKDTAMAESSEIALYTINRLINLASEFTECEKLFVATIDDADFLENWIDLVDERKCAEVWTETSITSQAPWEVDTLNVFKEMKVGDMLHCNAGFPFLIVRIK